MTEFEIMGEVAMVGDLREVPRAMPASSALALDLPKTMTFDDWSRLGEELSKQQKVLNWWIGDWWAFGAHRYGERARLAAEGIFGKGFGALANIASVARSFETSRRREHLSFTHHVEVAPLPPEKADAILDRAEREDMSVSQVRAAVRIVQGRTVGEALSARDDDPDHFEVLTIARAWNRAQIRNRETFMELARDAELGDIDP